MAGSLDFAMMCKAWTEFGVTVHGYVEQKARVQTKKENLKRKEKRRIQISIECIPGQKRREIFQIGAVGQ